MKFTAEQIKYLEKRIIMRDLSITCDRCDTRDSNDKAQAGWKDVIIELARSL